MTGADFRALVVFDLDGTLPEAAQTRVRSAQEAQLDIVAERVLTAHTLEEALGPLPLI